jgi:hypothetical protein
MIYCNGGMAMDIKIGDVLTMKKQHPCGSKDWEVTRIGADFKMKCCGCGHMVMLPRVKVEKNVRKINEIKL